MEAENTSFLGKCVGLWHPLAVVDEPALLGEYETGPVEYECGHGVMLTRGQRAILNALYTDPKMQHQLLFLKSSSMQLKS